MFICRKTTKILNNNIVTHALFILLMAIIKLFPSLYNKYSIYIFLLFIYKQII